MGARRPLLPGAAQVGGSGHLASHPGPPSICDCSDSDTLPASPGLWGFQAILGILRLVDLCPLSAALVPWPTSPCVCVQISVFF